MIIVDDGASAEHGARLKGWFEGEPDVVLIHHPSGISLLTPGLSLAAAVGGAVDPAWLACLFSGRLDHPPGPRKRDSEVDRRNHGESPARGHRAHSHARWTGSTSSSTAN